MKTFFSRNILRKFSDTQYLFINLIESPLLAFILAYLSKYSAESGYLLAANNVAMGDIPFAGHSVAHGPDGTSLCQFEFDEGAKVVSIDVSEVARIRSAVPVFSDRRPELY